ncbi:TonB C-terminal domain-containing protein [Sulfurimonas paralvinellae]|uniref:TonB C-terminal domain-containing protein n=2 Tax=Sulfurimonas paralvinellae TaxID=317658 RepID=A0A7M1B954_9BACT|nr:TonB C-terminal domain-containing protein [Sulfurimonas paralvinellae]
MDKNNNYFIISGFISLSLFLFFLGLFIYMMFVVKNQPTYALTKDKFIAVSIVMPKNIAKFTSSVALPSSSSKSVSQDIDVNDLFSDVWTQKIKHTQKKKKVNSKRIADIAKKIKTADKNKINSVSEKIGKLDMQESDKNTQQTSSADEVNEYLAKIQAIVYQHFNVPPNSEGNSVKTVIELDPFGHMTDFRILSYSANEALNAEADRIKERLKSVVFPKNPTGKSSRTIVVLISKE